MAFKGIIRNIIYKVLPQNLYLRILYYNYHKKILHIKNPKRFTEKLFLLKYINRENELDLIQKIYDKYSVREYIENKNCGNYLPKLYGIYENVESIPFESFPEKYAIKITQSCGYNIIKNGSNKISIDEMKLKLQLWLEQSNNLENIKKRVKEEFYYYNGKAKIICEEYLADRNGKIGEDIRFYCFNGKPKFFSFDFESVDENGDKRKEYIRNVYSLDKEFIPVEFGRPNNEKLELPRIENFEEMISLASKLCEDFTFVRVDMYDIDGRIIIGELTPIPMGGGGKIVPDSFDYEWGESLNIFSEFR